MGAGAETDAARKPGETALQGQVQQGPAGRVRDRGTATSAPQFLARCGKREGKNAVLEELGVRWGRQEPLPLGGARQHCVRGCNQEGGAFGCILLLSSFFFF